MVELEATPAEEVGARDWNENKPPVSRSAGGVNGSEGGVVGLAGGAVFCIELISVQAVKVKISKAGLWGGVE